MHHHIMFSLKGSFVYESFVINLHKFEKSQQFPNVKFSTKKYVVYYCEMFRLYVVISSKSLWYLWRIIKPNLVVAGTVNHKVVFEK